MEGEQELLQTIQDSQIGYALVLKLKTKEVHQEVPKEVSNLLQKYKRTLVGDTPNELPPLRDISHQIDFIPGASLPNKVAYKMTLDQNAKVSRQINDLLSKGPIQKSLIPCVVPSVLAHKKVDKWRLCTNSRKINKITIIYRFPIPRIEDLLDQLA